MDENAGFELDDQSFEREIEALLFASDTPLSAAKLAALTGAASSRRVLSAIGALSSFYLDSGRSYTIVEVAGGYQLTTLPEFSGTVSRLFKGKKKAKLTQPALEALAIVAYKQPVQRATVDDIRGVQTGPLLRSLLERGLIKVVGRQNVPGRPILYGTSRLFLQHFGLKSLKDLPRVAELAPP